MVITVDAVHAAVERSHVRNQFLQPDRERCCRVILSDSL